MLAPVWSTSRKLKTGVSPRLNVPEVPEPPDSVTSVGLSPGSRVRWTISCAAAMGAKPVSAAWHPAQALSSVWTAWLARMHCEVAE